MKPAWDDLEKAYLDSDLVTIVDVDCTADGKPVCDKVGVSGYPTIKYWLAGGEPGPKGKDYSGGRDASGLKSFVAKTFKPACIPSSGDGCTDDQKGLIEEFKDKDLAAERETLESSLKAAKSERKTVEEEFKQKRTEMKAAEKATSQKLSVIKLLEKESGKAEL